MKKLSLFLLATLILLASGCAKQAIQDESYKAYKKQQQIEAADKANRELK